MNIKEPEIKKEEDIFILQDELFNTHSSKYLNCEDLMFDGGMVLTY